MRRTIRFVLTLAAALAASSEARAQYGYGGGWGAGRFDARQQHGPRAGHDGHGRRHVYARY